MRMIVLLAIVSSTIPFGCRDKRSDVATSDRSAADSDASHSAQLEKPIGAPVVKAESAESNDDPLINEELKKLQGEWVVDVSMFKGENEIGTRNGFETTETTATMTINGDKLSIVQVTQGKGKAIGAQLEFSFAIDPTKDPKEMDLKDGKLNDVLDMHPFSGRTLPAIYDLNDDKLRIAIAISPDPKRPE